MKNYEVMALDEVVRELDDLLGWTDEEGTPREMFMYLRDIMQQRAEPEFAPLLELVTGILVSGRDITIADIAVVDAMFLPIAHALCGPDVFEV